MIQNENNGEKLAKRIGFNPFTLQRKKSLDPKEISSKFLEGCMDNKRLIEEAKNNKIHHGVALKEITFYLTLLKIDDEISLGILIQLFKEFDVDESLAKSVYTTHRQFTEAYIKDKIDAALEEKQDKIIFRQMTGKSKLFLQIAGFLTDDPCIFEILRLNKKIRKDLKREIYGLFLTRNRIRDPKVHIRLQYNSIPDHYKVACF